jgi:cephalosporin hydroxylase
MVILDSDHTRQHVARELEAWAPFITPGFCMIAADGVMRDLADVPGGDPAWLHDNPATAAREFLAAHPEFELRQPDSWTTYFPDAWLWRKP